MFFAALLLRLLSIISDRCIHQYQILNKDIDNISFTAIIFQWILVFIIYSGYWRLLFITIPRLVPKSKTILKLN